MNAGTGPARACALDTLQTSMELWVHIHDGRPCPGKQPHAND
jgi:hypothetical protein